MYIHVALHHTKLMSVLSLYLSLHPQYLAREYLKGVRASSFTFT